MADSEPSAYAESTENHTGRIVSFTTTVLESDDAPPPYISADVLDQDSPNHLGNPSSLPTLGIRSRMVSLCRQLKRRGAVIFINIKHSVLKNLPQGWDDNEKWNKLLLALIYCLFIVLGLAGFSLGVLERSTLQMIELEEPVFMYDSVEILKHSSMITISVSALFTIAGFLGCWGVMAKNRLMLMVHYAVLSATLVPIIYHGFGQEAAYGLPEWHTHSAIMRAKLTEILKSDYGLDHVCGPPGFHCTTKKWNNIQKSRSCCGIAPRQANIYLSSVWYRHQKKGDTNGRIRVPKSCCVRTKSGGYVNRTRCQTSTSSEQYAGARHTRGCDIKQAKSLRQMQLRLSILVLFLAVIALLLFTLTIINNIPEMRP